MLPKQLRYSRNLCQHSRKGRDVLEFGRSSLVKILRDGPLGAFGPRDVGSVISGLCRCLRKFVHVIKDGEAMTAANVTLDSSPMQLVSV